MHSALWRLLWLDLRGSLRQIFRVRRSWRQWLLLLMLLMFVGLFVGSQLLSGRALQSAGGAPQAARFGVGMPFWALLYLLASWLTAAADRGLVMRPAEIHFLVSGPFTTREILTLNLVRLAYRSLMSATILAVIGLAYLSSFLAGLIGLWLLIMVSLLVGMLVSLTARQATPALVRNFRRLLSVAAVVLLISLVAQAVQVAATHGRGYLFSTIAVSATQTPIGRVVLPPIAWLFAPLRAEAFWPTVPLQLLTRLPVILLLSLGILAAGGGFGEAATDRTDRALARRQAALRSGSNSAWNVSRKLRLPMFGYIGGVGPVAWVQMVQALRLMPRFILYTSTVVGVILVVPIVMDRDSLTGIAGLGWLTGLTAYTDFLLLLQLPLGFLGPPAQREVFKVLPISSWRIVVGKLAGPLLPLLASHLLTLGLFLVLVPEQRWETVQTAVALVPLAVVLVATINLLGLWNVIRPRALQQRDALAAGRAMLSVWLFSVMLIPVAILAVMGAAVSSLIFGPHLTAYLLGAAAGLSLAAFVLVVLLTWGFDRWQPIAGESRDQEQELNR